MTKVKDHLALLGLPVRDCVTGFSGTITSISFDLYGCIQATVHQGMQPDGKMGDQCWFDVGRLAVANWTPVMPVPNFDFGEVADGLHGPADKPAHNKA